jgi:hypothetical protein
MKTRKFGLYFAATLAAVSLNFGVHGGLDATRQARTTLPMLCLALYLQADTRAGRIG